MKTKSIPVLLAAGAIAIASSGVANAADAPKLSFSCQVREGIPTTIAQSVDGSTEIPFFYWKAEALANRTSNSPDKLCNDVSQKLADLSVNYDLSNIKIVGTAQGGLPTICVNTEGENCSKMLFTLGITEKPDVVAGDVVNSILAQNLQPEKKDFRTRGVQSISYQVDFWSLMGLKFSDKY